MKTDVYFARRGNSLIIAYLNEKQQEVFLFISGCTYSPFLRDKLFLSNEISIEKVLNDPELEIEEKVSKLIRKCNARGGTDNISIAYLIRTKEGEE